MAVRDYPQRRIRKVVEGRNGNRIAFLSCTHYRAVDQSKRKNIRCRACHVLRQRLNALVPR
jgi:uncharacterized ParB-like nuclease family protein